MFLRVKGEGLIPTRAYIGMMIFTACFIAYVIRTHISINIIAMVKPLNSTSAASNVAECVIFDNSSATSNNNNSHDGLIDSGPRYDWDANTRGFILGAFFWGYTISSLPGGTIAEMIGPKKIITISSIVSGLCIVLTPLAASWSGFIVLFFRFILGVVGGLIYPALQCLIAYWATPEEKGKFIGALLGSSLGTVATWPVLGEVIEAMGWNWAFYIPGIIVFAWTIMWHFLVYDTPNDHPRISDKERLYITENIGAKKTKGLPPYCAIITSVPFWAMTLLQFGNLWGLFFLMTAGPTFMSKVLGFNLSHSGFFAALPYLARMIFGFIFGYVADIILQKKWMSKGLIRKTFVIFSHILPGVFLFIQTLTGCDVTWAIVLITLSLGLNGASTVTNLQNSQDLAPNYAGSLYGIATCFGGTAGFISPQIVAAITAKGNGLHEWHIIFYIGASVYIASAIIFLIFGSADEQPWNKQQEEAQPKGVVISGIDNKAFEPTMPSYKQSNVETAKV